MTNGATGETKVDALAHQVKGAESLRSLKRGGSPKSLLLENQKSANLNSGTAVRTALATMTADDVSTKVVSIDCACVDCVR